MTVNGGKDYLRTCLANIDPTQDIDQLFYYKYANRKHIADYQTDTCVTRLSPEEVRDLNPEVSFVITCYIHIDFYVAWHQGFGRGNGKYIVYKHDLIVFENDPDRDYMECIVGNGIVENGEDARAYIFRKESGFRKFFHEVFPNQDSENTTGT